MIDAQLRAVMHGLGIDDNTARVLLLLPLVEVAWADGSVQDSERSLITGIARDRGLLSPDGQRLLESWLAWPPSVHYLARGRMVLVELAHSQAGLDPSGLRDVVDLCREVARAAGGLFGRWGAVSEVEDQAISDITDALSLDPERNWGALLSDLPATGLPVGTGPAPLLELSDDDAAFDVTDAQGVIPDVHALLGSVDADPLADTLTGGSPPPPLSPAALAAATGQGQGPRLELLSDEAEPVVFPLRQGSSQIGRRPDSDVVVAWDGEVSRQHCRIMTEQGRWVVADSGSINGTWVNDERVLERSLFGGEAITVGQSRFRFLL